MGCDEEIFFSRGTLCRTEERVPDLADVVPSVTVKVRFPKVVTTGRRMPFPTLVPTAKVPDVVQPVKVPDRLLDAIAVVPRVAEE